MVMRKSTIFLSFMALNLAAFLAIAAHAVLGGRDAAPFQTMRRGLVKHFSLTDLVLFTDARYTRHPAMADLHTPFQDYPMSLEHFPSGSLLGPPPHVRAYGRH
jgi:hypothetical protein